MPGAGNPVACDAEVRQRADHGLFDAVDVFLDEIARALQVDQRVGHHLTGAVEGDLPPRLVAMTGISPVQHMVAFACYALGG